MNLAFASQTGAEIYLQILPLNPNQRSRPSNFHSREPSLEKLYPFKQQCLLRFSANTDGQTNGAVSLHLECLRLEIRQRVGLQLILYASCMELQTLNQFTTPSCNSKHRPVGPVRIWKHAFI